MHTSCTVLEFPFQILGSRRITRSWSVIFWPPDVSTLLGKILLSRWEGWQSSLISLLPLLPKWRDNIIVKENKIFWTYSVPEKAQFPTAVLYLHIFLFPHALSPPHLSFYCPVFLFVSFCLVSLLHQNVPCQEIIVSRCYACNRLLMHATDYNMHTGLVKNALLFADIIRVGLGL